MPLYYACLAGHSALAGALLEAGAVCNEYTFDGDRCHYACALLQSIENKNGDAFNISASPFRDEPWGSRCKFTQTTRRDTYRSVSYGTKEIKLR